MGRVFVSENSLNRHSFTQLLTYCREKGSEGGQFLGYSPELLLLYVYAIVISRLHWTVVQISLYLFRDYAGKIGQFALALEATRPLLSD